MPYDVEVKADGETTEDEQAMAAVHQKEARSAAIRRGMQLAHAAGVHIGRPPGASPPNDVLAKYQSVVAALQQGRSLRNVAQLTGVAVNTVRKVQTALEGIAES